MTPSWKVLRKAFQKLSSLNRSVKFLNPTHVDWSGFCSSTLCSEVQAVQISGYSPNAAKIRKNGETKA